MNKPLSLEEIVANIINYSDNAKCQASNTLYELIQQLSLCTQNDRIEIMSELNDNYCRHCGITLNGKNCHCTNDD